MKKFVSLALAVLLAILVAPALAEPVSIDKADPAVAGIIERGKLRVGVKADVPKFGYQELGGDFEGLEIDVAKALAAELLGDENAVEFTAVTAKTRGPLLDTGELDLIIATFTIKPDRILQYDFSKPYFVDAIGLLVKKDAGIASFQDLDGKTVGVAQSATTKDALTKAAEAAGLKVEFLEFATYPDIKAALDSDRVDCFSVDKAILMGYVDDGTVLLGDSFESQPYGVALKKDSAGLLAFVDSKLAALRAAGEIDALVAKWELAPVDWAQIDGYAATLWEEAAKLG